MLGTLDFTVSEHWGPFNFPWSTALNLYVRILHRSPALSESLHLDFLVCIMLTQ